MSARKLHEPQKPAFFQKIGKNTDNINPGMRLCSEAKQSMEGIMLSVFMYIPFEKGVAFNYFTTISILSMALKSSSWAFSSVSPLVIICPIRCGPTWNLWTSSPGS